MDLFEGKYIYVKGKLQGQAVDMVLDTGAGKTVVDKAWAEKVGLKLQGGVKAKGIGGRVAASFADSVQLEFGGTAIDDLKAVVIDMSFVGRMLGREMPVIVGVDVYNRMVVDFDYPHRRVRFLPAADFAYHGPGETVTVRPLPGSQMWMMPIRLDDAVGWFHIDTGSGGSLSLVADFDARHGYLERADRHSLWLGGGVGGFRSERTVSVAQVRAGEVALQDVPITVQTSLGGDKQLGCAGLLGAQILSRFRMICDFSRRQVHLEAATDAATRPFHRDRLGIYPLPTDKHLEVKLVAPGSPAEVAGVQAGTVIATINGKHGSPKELYKLLQQARDGAVVRLSDGKGREYTITTARYY